MLRGEWTRVRVVQIRALEGPNVYIHKPVLVMRINLEEYTDRDSFEFPGFVERLLSACPGLYDHHCAMGRPGGFVERLYGGTYMGHIIEHVALELQTQIGSIANFGKTRNAGTPSVYDVIIEYESEAAARFLLITAVEFVNACVHGLYYPLADRLHEAKAIKAKHDLGPSTGAIVRAAVSRDIPVRRIGNQSLLQLGTGRYRKFIEATISHNTSAVAVDIASDKSLTKQVLKDAGIKVPDGGVARTPEEAAAIFSSLGVSVVVKPYDGCQGKGVTIDVRDIQTLRDAFYVARDYSDGVLVEECITGRQYRLLVINNKVVAASERIPAHIIGDGAHTILQLVDIVNRQPDRGDDHEKPLTRITIDETSARYLQGQGKRLHDVPLYGEMVLLRDSANLSTGGIAKDVTDEVHPSFVQMAVRAGRAIGLDICGVDIMAPDISRPVDASCAVIEVNAAPGIRMHHYPSSGQARNVADAIVDMLFPKGAKSRIPVVAITGTNGKTTTTRMIGHMLQDTGMTVGMTTTDGIFVGGAEVLHGDTTGPQSARLVLSDPTVDVAVLETARGGIMRGGIAYGMADVGIITNVTRDHIGQDGLRELKDIVKVKSLIAECIVPGGAVVLNADDPELVKLAGRLKHKAIFTSAKEKNPILTRHLGRGGMAYFVRDGWIIEAAGSLEWKVIRIDELPITLHGAAWFHVANAMQAVAAARHLGLSRQQCAQSLSQFRSDTHNPGRVNIFKMPSGLQFIADYGHNPEGIRAVGEMVSSLVGKKVPAIVGFPGDRSDDVIREASRIAAAYFDPLYVKEDADKRGRQPGEIAMLIADEVKRVSPGTRVSIELDEYRALEIAVHAHPNDQLLLMFYEKLEPIRHFMDLHGGIQIPDLALAKRQAISAI